MDLPSQTARPTKYVTTTRSREAAPPRGPEVGEEAPSAVHPQGGRHACTHSWPATPEERGCWLGKRRAWGCGFRCSVSSRGHEAQCVGAASPSKLPGLSEWVTHARTDGRMDRRMAGAVTEMLGTAPGARLINASRPS